MDVAELASVGAQIVEIGGKLKELREQRDAVNAHISELEKELMPLVTLHAKIIAHVIGAPIPSPAPPPALVPAKGGGSSGSSGGPTPQVLTAVKKKVVDFLQDAEPGMSAAEVAQALRLDPSIVRQAMADLSRSGR